MDVQKQGPGPIPPEAIHAAIMLGQYVFAGGVADRAKRRLSSSSAGQ